MTLENIRMILCNSTFEEFANEVKVGKKKIVFFGAGTIMNSWIPYIVRYFELGDYVDCCIDNDERKNNTTIFLNHISCKISSPKSLLMKDKSRIVILITSSYFTSILEQLDILPGFDKVHCYIAPIMHITHQNYGKQCLDQIIRDSQPLIPKVIHYCWFGKNPMPERNQICIESWRKYCPDYEIIEWNESNYDIHKNLYMKQAYDAGKWGYVPDYARVDLLYEHGGLYFDTDVEIIRNIDDLLYQKAFSSVEEYPTINIGGGSGSIKGYSLYGKIRDYRSGFSFINEDGSYNLKTCGFYETKPLEDAGLKLDGTLQQIQGMTIYPSDYFHPKSSVTGRTNITENTYSVHHFSWSWVAENLLVEKLQTHQNFEMILQRIEKDKTL